jgi:hypothetical protein
MGMSYIRQAYGVPAKRGGRIIYTGDKRGRAGGEGQAGVIVGSQGAHLRIRLDGQQTIYTFHPTWKIEYLTGDAQ